MCVSVLIRLPCGHGRKVLRREPGCEPTPQAIAASVESLQPAAAPADRPQAQAIAAVCSRASTSTTASSARRAPTRRSTSRQRPGRRRSGPSRSGSEFYDERVAECVERLRAEFDVESLGSTPGGGEALLHRPARRPPAARARRDVLQLGGHADLRRRSYSDNDLIFVRAAISTEYIDSDPPIYRSYYPTDGACADASSRSSSTSAGPVRSPISSATSATCSARSTSTRRRAGSTWSRTTRSRCSARAFYRNKAAYVVGKIVNGYRRAALRRAGAERRAGARRSTRSCSTRSSSTSSSRSRAPTSWSTWTCPPGYVEFLRRMMPTKTALRALHDARPRQAGQDALLPRPAAAPPPLAGPLRPGARHSRAR